MIVAGKWVVTFGDQNRVLEDAAVLVKGPIIEEVGSRDEIIGRNPDEELLDYGDRLVMPGLICAHGHAYGAFARGMPLKAEAPSNFPEILERLWWRLDKELTLEDTYYSGLVTAIEAVRHGTTTMVDHHASPNAISDSLERLSRAFREVGVRGCLAYEVSDRDGREKAEEGVRENVEFIERSRGDPLIRGSFGLHASLTLSDETLDSCLEASKDLDTGFHLHVAEDRADVTDSLKKSGRRVVERLWDHGMLGKKTIAVHCVHVNTRELEMLKETGTKVVHNPESNMNNAVGVAPVVKMIEMGLDPALGTDGFTLDMFREAKVAYVLHKLHTADPRLMGADQVLTMLTNNNSRLLSEYFDEPVGMIERGAPADLIVLDYRPYTPIGSDNFPWHFIFGIDSSMVRTVIVHGRPIMKDREILTVDEERIHSRATELARDLWERL